MLRILTDKTFTAEYNSCLRFLVNSVWLEGQNFNAFFGRMLDNLSYLIFKNGIKSIAITDAYENQILSFPIDKSL